MKSIDERLRIIDKHLHKLGPSSAGNEIADACLFVMRTQISVLKKIRKDALDYGKHS